MADVFDFYVRDNRKINFEIAEPIMREDSGVTDFRFHIPKTLNGLEVSDWSWWFVFVNAKKEKYSVALTLSDDPESPLEFNIATYTVDYAMSIKAGAVQFALEAINTGTGGAIDNEWHTLTYETKVKETLQGNQAEYAETESDIISALLEEVRTKMNQIIGGATPTPVPAVSQMTDTSKLYLLTTDGEWYYYNGSAWVSGGVYGAGIQIDSTLSKSGQAADAKKTGDAITSLKEDLSGDIDELKGSLITKADTDDMLKAFVTDTASGSIASFTDGADNIPMKDVLVHIEPVQAGSGDPSPDNVRPITGWTGAKVTRAGKNIFLPARTSGTTTNNGITFTYNADGSVIANGTATGSAFTPAYQNTGLRFRLPPGRYKKSGASGNFDGILIQYIDPANPTSSWVTIATSTSTSFTVSETVSNYDLVVRVRISAGKTLEDEIYHPYIFFDSSNDTYEPYTGTTYSITFPSSAGTVYGGTLDVTSGVLTVDRKMSVYDGTESWGSQVITDNVFNVYTAASGKMSDRKSGDIVTELLSNEIVGSKDLIGGYGFISSGGYLNVRMPDTIASAADWKTYLASNNLQIVYPLATPITYQLTPQEITSLLGENNIWSDTGDTEVEYRADVKLYINKKIAEAISALS